MDEVRLGTEFETGDVQNLAGTLVDPTGKGLEDTGSSAHFNKLARSLLVGIIIHALYKREKTGEIASLDEIDIILQGKVQDDSYWEGLKKYEGVDKLMTSRHLCAIRLHERKTAMP